MKSTTLFQPAILCLAIVFSFVSCQKDFSFSGGNNRSAVSNNKPPFADAGRDTTIMLPGDNVTLDGSASYDPDGKTTNFFWRQISGSLVAIADSQAAKTTAKNLSPGIYQFELTVTDNGGLSSKDTLMVTVLPSGSMTNPYYSKNLNWIFPWYAALEIKNIYLYVPQGRPFKVFIQRGFNPTWIEVQPLSADPNHNTYEYFIETRLYGAGIYNYGSLYVFYYGTDTNDTPNVKIEF
ncbi:MAG TPA: PKD domain-containing protein [Flavisolibacter sp.]|jgi:hypothetical protein|nr:PKD domain-containing protein [Flavisolibacter sp.]